MVATESGKQRIIGARIHLPPLIVLTAEEKQAERQHIGHVTKEGDLSWEYESKS
jgi:hypothetical protein